MKKKICLWGKGYGVERIIELCINAGVAISAILDNDPSKWGHKVLGVIVVPPDQLMELKPNYILVLSQAIDAITKQATGMGFPEESILHFNRNPWEALKRIGAEYAIYHYKYEWDGERLQKFFYEHAVIGKHIKRVSPKISKEQQIEIVSKLIKAFNIVRNDAKTVPEIYRVGENWGNVLKGTWGNFYELSEKNDIVNISEMLSNFCRNPLSHSIMGGEGVFNKFINHPGQESWLQHNLEVWMALVDGKASLDEVGMPPIGNPYGYNVDGQIINWNSFVNHGRAFRTLRLLSEEDHPVVAEIGGGFGGYAYNLLRNKRKLTYIDFDLPENLLIASYYLSMAYPEKNILIYDSESMIMDIAHLKKYDAVMMPNFMLPKLQDASVDLFINTISFSEMEYKTICEYFNQIDRIGSKYFYHENLACHPEYKGYPSAIFPQLNNFTQIFSSISPWQGFDAYALGHTYIERLFLHSR
ncbi:putative sugar O-methyltransferase [uncultured Desulfobacter sp.]|uniref:putative sugar O-methyltransferase n=1 Tax=uncultured Desulfobacter sp. TaxID=240139 RepID=UPI002AAB56B2|nr:putative sugar O-methyltransferase [uncultured Desulfobacter sp.]